MIRRVIALSVIVCATFALGTGPTVSAQGAAPQSGAATNQDILNELKAIRQLLEALNLKMTPPAPAAAAPAGDRRVHLGEVSGLFFGRADAPLTMVEFTDLQCPFCRQFHMTSFEQIKRDYIDTGKVRFYSRDFPIDSLHPLAINAARASSCAADQNKFWEMRHLILMGNAQLRPDSFGLFAQDLKLEPTVFRNCFNDPASHREQLVKDSNDARALGITGTPSFVLGKTIPSGLDGVMLVGAAPFAAFDAKIKEMLATVR